MAKRNPCKEKHREFGNFVKTQGILSKHRENTGNFVSSSCKCSDSKSKGYCDSCRKNIHFFPEAKKVNSVYVILTNYVNWYRENLRSDRENTGKTQGIWKYNLSGYPGYCIAFFQVLHSKSAEQTADLVRQIAEKAWSASTTWKKDAWLNRTWISPTMSKVGNIKSKSLCSTLQGIQ